MLVIGGGPGGYTAALYGARAGPVSYTHLAPPFAAEYGDDPQREPDRAACPLPAPSGTGGGSDQRDQVYYRA